MLGHIWGNIGATKQKPTTTWVAGYIMETADSNPRPEVLIQIFLRVVY